MADEENTSRIDVFDEPEEKSEEVVEEKGEEVSEPVEATGDGEVTAEPEKDAQVEPPSTEDEEVGLKAAIVAERRKRQEAERKVRELQEKDAPDPEEDPEGFAAHVKTAAWQEKVDNSRELMMDVHDDYEEMEAVFMQMVRDESGEVIDPARVAKMNSARNPAKFAYDEAKAYLEAEQYRDPEKRAALISQEVEKALEAKLKEIQKPKEVDVTQLPNLTGATSAGSNTLKQARPVETLGEVFGEED